VARELAPAGLRSSPDPWSPEKLPKKTEGNQPPSAALYPPYIKKVSLNPFNQKPWTLQQKRDQHAAEMMARSTVGFFSRCPSGCGFPFDLSTANRLVVMARPAVLRMSEQK
jgi:hypothetical protein